MSELIFGQLQRVDPRTFWPHEAMSFTPWLAQHIEELGEALDLDLEVKASEAPVGSFSLDLLCHDLGRDRTVIVENQLEATDHDHLGKLITYAAGFEASVVVWLSREIREEHRQALEWLNAHTDERTEFFAVVLEVLQIDGSKPAVNFRPVVFPNGWRKGLAPTPQPASERGERYRTFFQSLIDELRTSHNFTNAKVAQPQNWYSFPCGISGVVFSAAFTQKGPSVQVYIDREDQTINKAVFDRLVGEQAAIEMIVGHPLSWERLDARRACRIALYRDGSIDDNTVEQAQLRKWMVDLLLKFRIAFKERLRDAVDVVEGGLAAT